MIINYPSGFGLHNLGDFVIPTFLYDTLSVSYSWDETFVEVTGADDDTILLIKAELHRVASQAFDLEEEEKVIRKRRRVKQWLKSRPGVVDFMKQSPAEQISAIDAMTNAQLKTTIGYLAVFTSALLRDLLEDD